MKKTLVIGASANTERYSNKAVRALKQKGIPVFALGLKEGIIEDVKIQIGFPNIEDVDTVSLYIATKHQSMYYDYIIKLKPRRVIFNPGTENPNLEDKLQKKGVEVLEACTLVMLSIGNY